MIVAPAELPIDLTAVHFASCHAAFNGRELVLRNRHIERRWRVDDGLLYATSFRDLATGREWLARAAREPSPTPPFGLTDEPRRVRCRAWGGPQGPTEEPSLVVELEARGDGMTLTYRFQLFPASRGVTVQLVTEGSGVLCERSTAGALASGIERAESGTLPSSDVTERLDTRSPHLRLTQVELYAQTDIHNALAHERTWLLHPNDGALALTGNLFILEDPLTGDGLALLKHAPLPGERPCPTEADLRVDATAGALYLPKPEQAAFGPEHPRHPVGYRAALYGHGTGDMPGVGYPCTALAYTGGAAGRTRALHDLQRQFRRLDPARDLRFLSNTWGDRSQDGRVCEAFLREEIAAAARLGVDVVQIDDGWQRGRTANSVQRGGVWQGYWASDPEFWTTPHPERFPNGLAPLVALARAHDLRLGLWFAPDSSDDFAQWERDAEAIIALHDREDINYVKLDSVNITSRLGEARFAAFIERVLCATRAQVSFDLDITAQRRPGYFGAMTAGPLFLENRYSDFRRYWPHQTLRNLWTLAHYVDPARLRIELLNPARNGNLYQDDPLAPACYPPAYLFATAMMANPLGWFEVSNLPEAVLEDIAPLVRTWRVHRTRLAACHVLPIGAPPDGTAWTGFAAEAPSGGGYLLLFRERHPRATWSADLPVFAGQFAVELLAGDGEVNITDGQVRATIPEELRFVFARVRPA